MCWWRGTRPTPRCRLNSVSEVLVDSQNRDTITEKARDGAGHEAIRGIPEKGSTMSDERTKMKLTLKISSQKGTCAYGHEEGQVFDVSTTTPAGMCPAAFCSAYPAIFALQLGTDMPWEKEKGVAHIACPDPDNPLTMEIRRES